MDVSRPFASEPPSEALAGIRGRRLNQEVMEQMANHRSGRQATLMSYRLQDRNLPAGQEERNFHHIPFQQRRPSFLDAILCPWVVTHGHRILAREQRSNFRFSCKRNATRLFLRMPGASHSESDSSVMSQTESVLSPMGNACSFYKHCAFEGR